MGIGSWLTGILVSSATDGYINKLAAENKANPNVKDENLYKNDKIDKNDPKDVIDGKLGVLLTWIESKPGIGDILKSLGPNRRKLYGTLAQPGGNIVSIVAPITQESERLIVSTIQTDKLLTLPRDPKLPLNDPLNELISGYAVHKLYSQMLHPPQTYLGNKFQFRSADGSDNVCELTLLDCI